MIAVGDRVRVRTDRRPVAAPGYAGRAGRVTTIALGFDKIRFSVLVGGNREFVAHCARGCTQDSTTEADDWSCQGMVWIKSTSSVLSVGLESVLKQWGIRLHRGPEALQYAAAPSVVVYSLEGEDELASEVGRLKELAPNSALVVFGASADVSLARAAVRAGADGFLHAGMPHEQIVRALQKAHDGEEVMPRELLRRLVAEMVAKEGGSDLSELGSRKVEILEMVVEGLSNAQIAKRLYLSESTVKQHLRAAYKALGVKNRNQAAALLLSRDGLRGAGPREA